MSKQFSYTALLMVIVQVLFSLYAKADDDLVRYKLEAQTVAGKPIAPNSSISAGQEFVLIVKAIDLRADPSGIFAAHVNIFYDANLVEQLGGFDRTQTDFPNATRGMFFTNSDNMGFVENLGGLGGISFSNKAEHEIARMRFRAISKTGHIRFQCDQTEDQLLKPTLLYALNNNTLRCEHNYCGFSLRFAGCDFNTDGNCDVQDLNQLLATGDIAQGVEVNRKNRMFDLNGNFLIDNDDLLAWLELAAEENNLDSAYIPGDANLDGVTDVSDFNIWNSNRFSFSSRWDHGDFNGDGVIDVSDFNVWNSNKFQSSSFECSE